MTKRISIIIVSLTLLVIAFFIGYTLKPQASSIVSPTTAPAGSIIIPVSIVSLKETSSTSPSISIEYPQFPSLTQDFNTAIASSVMSRLDGFKSAITQNESDRQTAGGDASIPPSAYSFIATWQPAQINSDYVSFIIRFDDFSGGANEDHDLQTFNYDVAQKNIMTLDDLFGNTPDYLTSISGIAGQQLIDSLNQSSNGSTPTDMISAGTEPTPDNFQNFTFTDDVATFYFPECAVAPCSFGEQDVQIPRDEVK